MNKGQAHISVIIPVHNGATFLGEAISSVQRQVIQPLEILVVDDGSTDESMAIARKSGSNVRCLHQANAGPAAARNLGWQKARGELIAFLDADDLWPADKLDNQINALVKKPSAGIAFGSIQCLKRSAAEGGIPEYVPFGRTWRWCLLGASLIRRTIFDRVGTFNPALRFGEDLDWFLRAREIGIQTEFIERVTLFYRIHSGNMTGGIPHSGFHIPLILKHHLDRQRTTGR